MKRTDKYVALDVHQATTVGTVREERGRVIARTILPTEAPAQPRSRAVTVRTPFAGGCAAPSTTANAC
jgi:hypothetical protein